jgi:hypothetical protein
MDKAPNRALTSFSAHSLSNPERPNSQFSTRALDTHCHAGPWDQPSPHARPRTVAWGPVVCPSGARGCEVSLANRPRCQLLQPLHGLASTESGHGRVCHEPRSTLRGPFPLPRSL